MLNGFDLTSAAFFPVLAKIASEITIKCAFRHCFDALSYNTLVCEASSLYPIAC